MSIIYALSQLASNKFMKAVFVVFLLVQGYLLIRPSEPPLDPVRAEAVERVANQVAESIGTHAEGTWSSRYVRVARFQGDPGDHLRKRLEGTLQGRTNCRIVTDTIFEDLRAEAAAKAVRLGVVSQVKADSWKSAPVTRLEEALKVAEGTGVDYVVYGTVSDFRSLRGKVYLRLNVAAANVAAGTIAFDGDFSDGDDLVFADVPGSAFTAASRSAGLRIVGWLLFVLLIPLITGGFWIELLNRHSNATNIACLFFLTVIDVLLAWALIGFWLGTPRYTLLLLLALLASGTWNLFILNVFERTRVSRLGM